MDESSVGDDTDMTPDEFEALQGSGLEAKVVRSPILDCGRCAGTHNGHYWTLEDVGERWCPGFDVYNESNLSEGSS